MSAPYVKNIPGDFYVEDACCLTCAVPMTEAPEFFEMDEEQCFVKRQPETAVDFDRMLDALTVQEVGCIRYKGFDRQFIQRLVDAGEAEICDTLDLVKDIRQTLRPFIRIGCDRRSAKEVLSHLTDAASEVPHFNGEPYFKFRTLTADALSVTMEFSWPSGSFHSFSINREPGGTYLVELLPAEARLIPAVARTFCSWLSRMPSVYNVTCMSEAELQEGKGYPSPY